MSSTIQRTPKSNNKQSLFFNDLATPVSTRRTGSGNKFTTPGQAAAVSALWRQNFATSDLPPPPVFTLEDRADFSPEPDYPIGSPQPDPIRTPTRTPSSKMFSNSSPGSGGGNPSSTSGWWSDRGKGVGVEGAVSGSPVDGVVNREKVGELITLPPPREVARPEVMRNVMGNGGGMVDEEEWVTVYGFSPADTNLVLREFEKCGVVLKHVTGPRDSNWMHILYQSRFDAQKALNKNGMQLNGALIIGVKPVDPMQRQSLSDRLHNQGFIPIPPQTSTRKSEAIAFNASARAYQQNDNTNTSQTGGTMASPAKSVVSKIVDLMFGL